MNHPVRGAGSSGTSRAGVVRMLCVTVLGVAALGALVLFPAPALAADGPLVEAYSPPTGSADISTLWAPWVKFTIPIDVATVTGDTFFLTPLGSSTKVPATLTLHRRPETGHAHPHDPAGQRHHLSGHGDRGHQGHPQQPAAIPLGLDLHRGGGRSARHLRGRPAWSPLLHRHPGPVRGRHSRRRDRPARPGVPAEQPGVAAAVRQDDLRCPRTHGD